MFKEGDHVAYMNNGAFGEYQTIQVGFSVPDPNPEYIPLMVSGLTAALALENNGVDVFQKGRFIRFRQSVCHENAPNQLSLL